MHAIAFAPHVSYPVLWTLAVLAVLLCAAGFALRARGAALRLLAFTVIILTVSNPEVVKLVREPLNDVAVIVIDRSQSMQIGDRAADAEKALRAVKERLAREPNLEVRVVAVNGDTPGEDNGTQAFAALDAAWADVAPTRIAGAILITDGEVHDVPSAPRLDAPINALVVGSRDEADRKLTIVDASRYGIVGQTAKIVLRIDDLPATVNAAGAKVRVNLRIDGANIGTMQVPLSRNAPIEVPIRHEGESVVEIEAESGPHELTLQNNRAVVTINGVRDRLRVLLVSGVPNAGERVWRSLLKGDPSVDLVHFTILRPPEKQMQDETPASELALIVFPTQELFSERLSSFDLVIFDRFGEQGILPMLYYSNIAEYVEHGGALLISAGPEFAGTPSIYRTPLSAVLPARPTGGVIAQPFKPRLTAEGFAHPVTHDLTGAGTPGTPPAWGRWFRQIGAAKLSGETVMSGADGKPLLVLDRVGKGRVAELLSDQGWLWSRGFEGGGPEAELLRRIAHWLMKEPQLEEESLTARISGSDIEVERHSMAKTPPPITLTDPSGRKSALFMQPIEPGLWKGRAVADALGLYRVSDGKLTAVAAAGPLNPKEVADMRSTDSILRPIAALTGGTVRWYADGLPDVARIERGDRGNGRDFSLTRNAATRVSRIEQFPLLPPWLGFLLTIGALLLAWYREGK